MGALCVRGKTSFARFLALVPDRLRLARGASVREVRVPVAVPVDVMSTLADAFGSDRVAARPRIASEPRRLLRLCQIDGDIDLWWLDGWYEHFGPPLIQNLARVYAKGFDEVGAGEGGEETAYWVHLQLIDVLHRALGAAPAERRMALSVLAMTMLDVAMQAALEPSGRARTNLGARLGLQFAATLSPCAVGLDPETLALRPLNPYRTIPTAVALALRVIQGPIESIDLTDVVQTFTERLRRDPEVQAELTQRLLADLVRDCALVLVLQHGAPGPGPSNTLRGLAASGTKLLETIVDRSARVDLIAQLDRAEFGATKPARAMVALLTNAGKALDGDTSVLGPHGNLTKRAALAASGAVALVLDHHAAEVARQVRGIAAHVAGAEADAQFAQGRCYRLSWDDQPLYRTPHTNQSAVLFVDTRDLASRVVDVDAQSIADFTRACFYEPVLDLARSLSGPEGRAVRLISFSESGLAFEGDIVSLVHLGAAVTQIVDATNAGQREAVADALGGTSSRQRELEREIAAIDARINSVESELRSIAPGAHKRMLQVEWQSLDKQRLALARNRDHGIAATRGRPLEVGMFLSVGEPSVAFDATASAPSPQVVLSKALVEARLASRQSAAVGYERKRTLEAATRTRGQRDPTFVARVSVRSIVLGALGDQQVSEVHNVGCGISKAALDAYVNERAGVLEFQQTRLCGVDLDAPIRDAFIFDNPNEVLMTATRPGQPSPVLMFRKVGVIDLGPLDASHRVDAWELIPVDSPFVRMLFGRSPGSVSNG